MDLKPENFVYVKTTGAGSNRSEWDDPRLGLLNLIDFGYSDICQILEHGANDSDEEEEEEEENDDAGGDVGDSDDANKCVVTRNAILGTPEYMSPEQIPEVETAYTRM